MEGITDLPERFLASGPLENDHQDYADDPNMGAWLRKEQLNLLLQLGYIAMENDKFVYKKRWLRSLVEVFSVRFVDSSPEQLDQIYGVIKIGVFGKTCTIFNRQIGDGQHCPFVGEGYARLAGGDGPIHDDDGIFIFPMLFKKNDTKDLFHPNNSHLFLRAGFFKIEHCHMIESISEDEMSGMEGECLCYRSGSPENLYDQLICRRLPSPCGPLEVNYAVYKDSAEAFVFLKLIEFKGEGEGGNTSVKVYGEVQASNTMLSDPRAKSMLFDRKSDESIVIRIGDYIPLRRPVVVVPFTSQLIVQFHLMFSCTDSGDVVTGIATTSFPARCWCHSVGKEIAEELVITGTRGKLQVKAAWSPSWAPSNYTEDFSSSAFR